MRIIDLIPDNQVIIEQAATLLVEGFREHAPQAWPDRDTALAEVRAALQADRICRCALDNDGTLLGWIGGIPQYSGKVWELHPLVVDGRHRGHGIGRTLVLDFEAQVKARGGITITLGTDDEDNQTSLSGTDLYPNPLEHLVNIRNLGGHPYEFYQKLGFVITGVLPDANGPGKPDIFMAKRVA
jgi:aminoglycoside 6'-N-acetyltransferase I